MPPVRNKNNKNNKNGRNKKIEKESLGTMSVSALKKKIRDIERYLKTNEKLSAKGQVDLERQLKACKLTLIEKVAESKEKNMTVKYRMVKHFDRKKVERAIKKVQKQLNEAQTPQEKTRIEKNLYELQIDFNYILYYPKNRKYLALHPTSGGEDEEMISKRNEIRQIIKEAMQNNDLESLNKRFREETKLQVIKIMNDYKKDKRQGEGKDNLKDKMNDLRNKKYINTSKTLDDDFFGSDDDDNEKKPWLNFFTNVKSCWNVVTAAGALPDDYILLFRVQNKGYRRDIPEESWQKEIANEGNVLFIQKYGDNTLKPLCNNEEVRDATDDICHILSNSSGRIQLSVSK